MTPFRVVVADPAWKFGDKLPGKGRGAEKHYNVMPTEQICMLQLPPIADDAILFLWRVAGMQEDALAVMHMWGFTLKSEIVWVKTKDGVVIEDWEPVIEEELAFGMGRYTRHCHEVCLIGTRGRAATKVVKNHAIRSVFFAEREEHSKKPEKFFSLVEKMVDGEGPFLELFARRQRAGWVAVGDELGTTLTQLGVNDGSSNASADGSGGASSGGGAGDEAPPPRRARGGKRSKADPQGAPGSAVA